MDIIIFFLLITDAYVLLFPVLLLMLLYLTLFLFLFFYSVATTYSYGQLMHSILIRDRIFSSCSFYVFFFLPLLSTRFNFLLWPCCATILNCPLQLYLMLVESIRVYIHQRILKRSNIYCEKNFYSSNLYTTISNTNSRK